MVRQYIYVMTKDKINFTPSFRRERLEIFYRGAAKPAGFELSSNVPWLCKTQQRSRLKLGFIGIVAVTNLRENPSGKSVWVSRGTKRNAGRLEEHLTDQSNDTAHEIAQA